MYSIGLHICVHQCKCPQPHVCNNLEPESSRSWTTHQSIMVKLGGSIIANLLNRLWGWHSSKLQHLVTAQSQSIWKGIKARSTNGAPNVLQWQFSWEPLFLPSISLPQKYEIQSPLWSHKQQWSHGLRQKTIFKDDSSTPTAPCSSKLETQSTKQS